MRDLTAVLASADPADKAEIYAQLGLVLTYRPKAGTVKIPVTPAAFMYVSRRPWGERILNPMRADRRVRPSGSAAPQRCHVEGSKIRLAFDEPGSCLSGARGG